MLGMTLRLINFTSRIFIHVPFPSLFINSTYVEATSLPSSSPLVILKSYYKQHGLIRGGTMELHYGPGALFISPPCTTPFYTLLLAC